MRADENETVGQNHVNETSCSSCSRGYRLPLKSLSIKGNEITYRITNNETWEVQDTEALSSDSLAEKFTNTDDATIMDAQSIPETVITTGQPMCRICLDSGNEPLVAPCQCDGSTKFIHETCLLTWFHKTRRKRCEICLSKVNIKSTGCKPMRKWKIPKGSYNFVFYFYVIYALATFCTSGIAFSVAVTEKCITPTCVALYIACILSILSLVYCAGFTIYIKLFWKAAFTANRNWRVYDRISFHRSEKPSDVDARAKDVRTAVSSESREISVCEEHEYLNSSQNHLNPVCAASAPSEAFINNNKDKTESNEHRRLSSDSQYSTCV